MASATVESSPPLSMITARPEFIAPSLLVTDTGLGPLPHFDASEASGFSRIEARLQNVKNLAGQVLGCRRNGVKRRDIIEMLVIKTLMNLGSQRVFQHVEVRAHPNIVKGSKLPEGAHRPGVAVKTVAGRTLGQHMGSGQSTLD